ncbi:MAG: hypothetical protein ABIP06_06420 [Pyrinomonadaceae bacterium]
MTEATVPGQPTTAQLLAAFAASLLPLAGPTGVAVAALIPAVQQLLAGLMSHPTANYSIDELVAIVASGSANFAKLQQHSDEAAAKEQGK